METMTADSIRYSRNADVVMRRIAGEALLIPIRKRIADLDCVYVLHGVGEFLWERIDGARTREDLVRDVVDRFVVEEAEASADVGEFLGELSKAGLVMTEQVLSQEEKLKRG
jgi:hypothetical protein